MQALHDFARDVRAGLGKAGQRELPSMYLYDEIGTALFEAITLLPEYGLTRADERLLRQYAPAILEHLPPPVVVAELGSGSGRKTRWVLEALARREAVAYYPVDTSPSALAKCRQELSGMGTLSIVGLEASYLDGLREVATRRRNGQTLLALFLGSTVGNFDFRYWDPIPVTATPLGDSAFCVSQLVGNGWEWTTTAFQPFPGFQPFPFYPGYSAPFFDGDHFVLKGASPRTAARLLRRSVRNWFRPNYPYVYAGFRCVDNLHDERSAPAFSSPPGLRSRSARGTQQARPEGAPVEVFLR